MHLDLTYFTGFHRRERGKGCFYEHSRKNHFDLFIYLNHVTMFIVTEFSKAKEKSL